MITPEDLRLAKYDCNNHDLFFRGLIKALLLRLDNDISVRSESIPHMILNTGDDTFWILEKSYTVADQSNEDVMYHRVPRAIVTPGGLSMIPDQLSNPYARGEFQIDEPDGIRSYSAEVRRMPVTMSVNVKYILSSFVDQLEVVQHIMTKLAFIRTFSFQYLGQRITASYKIPDQYEGEYQMEMDGQMTDSKDRTITIDLEVETTLPVYSYPSIVPLDKRITKPEWSVDTGSDKETRRPTEVSGYHGVSDLPNKVRK